MRRLADQISAYLQGDIALEQLQASVAEESTRPGTDLTAVIELLESAQGRGLKTPAFNALVARLQSTQVADSCQLSVPLNHSSEDQPAEATADEDDDEEEPTQLRGIGASDTETAFPDATHPPDALDTQATATGPIDQDEDTVLGHQPLPPGPSRNPADTAFGDVGAASSGSGHANGELGEGAYLRNRFQLVEKLGEGGMGAVWKGRDLLKVEARDRNPFVAIKLLQGDFREHPESFIALQRETAKQQRLAHPNIATVYDFDRDETRDIVFMTMEVLEGQSLDAFVADLPADGLSLDDALPIISQLAEGLSYAHENHLVHSDLKPSNCFLTREGTVKLLDFGIARASQTQADVDGEKTLFDPGELGALTPAYATVEMFEGVDPAPSDDVYALAVMSYQLLTGRHPYARKNAPTALAENLQPAVIDKLSRRQNRALVRALALPRKERTASVAQFIAELSPPPRSRGLLVAALAVFIGALTVPAYQWGTAFWADREDGHTLSLLQGSEEQFQTALVRMRQTDGGLRGTADATREQAEQLLAKHLIANALRPEATVNELFRDLQPRWRENVLGDPAVRDALVEAGHTRVNKVFSPKTGKLDFAAAEKIVSGLEALFPGSASVLRLRQVLGEQRLALREPVDRMLAQLSDPSAAPAAVSLSNVQAAFRLVREADAKNPLFSDPQARGNVLSAARAALENDDLLRAEVALQVAQQLSTPARDLQPLRAALQVQRTVKERASRLAELRQRLTVINSTLSKLEDFEPYREQLAELFRLEPDAALMRELRARVQQLFAAEMRATRDQNRFSEGYILLVNYAPLLELDTVVSERDALWKARPDGVILDYPNRPASLQALSKTVNALLARPVLTSTWEHQFEPVFKQYLALARPDNNSIETVRQSVALLFYDKSQAQIGNGNLEAGARSLARGLSYAPRHPKLIAARAGIQTALRQRQEDQRAAEREALRITGIATIETALREGNVLQAQDSYGHLLKFGEDASSPQMLTFAEALTQLTERAAAAALRKNDFAAAGKLAEATLNTLPELPAFAPMRERLTRTARLPRAVATLRTNLTSTASLDIGKTKEQMDTLAQLAASEHQTLLERFVAARRSQLINTIAARPAQPDELFRLTAEMQALAPAGDLDGLRNELSTGLAQAISAAGKRSAIAGHDLHEAAGFLASAKDVKRAVKKLPSALLARGESQLSAGRLTAAGKSLLRAKQQNRRSGKIARLEREVRTRKTAVLKLYEQYRFDMSGGRIASDTERRQRLQAVLSAWSDNPELTAVTYVKRRPDACWQGLAGLGNAPGMTCVDPLGQRQSGPALVVVPLPDAGASALAMMKYELSVAQFGAYCSATPECTWRGDSRPELPITGITSVQARAYAKWLSTQVSNALGHSVNYRLPTLTEWRAGAAANGAAANRALNCRNASATSPGGGLLRNQSGSLLLGTPLGRDLVDITFGEPNGFGVVNALGNAREWVLEDGLLLTAGGSYKDSISACTATFAASHNGAAEPTNGIRLVRALLPDEL